MVKQWRRWLWVKCWLFFSFFFLVFIIIIIVGELYLKVSWLGVEGGENYSHCISNSQLGAPFH
jgi:hypothetical protein